MKECCEHYEEVLYEPLIQWRNVETELGLTQPVKEIAGFSCPRCKHLLPPPYFTRETRCPNCKLFMLLQKRLGKCGTFGPVVVCWEGKP